MTSIICMPLSVDPIRYLSCVTRRPLIPSFPLVCVFTASFFLNVIRRPRSQPCNSSKNLKGLAIPLPPRFFYYVLYYY